MIDIAIVNSFLLFKKLHADMRRKTLTEFKVELAHQLLQSADIPDYATHGCPRSLPTPDHLRGFSLTDIFSSITLHLLTESCSTKDALFA